MAASNTQVNLEELTSTEKPKMMKDEKNRLLSFEGKPWQYRKLTKRKMAKAGLYYVGPGVKVGCPFCKLYLDNWEDSDDPSEEHKSKKKGCPYFTNRESCGNKPMTCEDELELKQRKTEYNNNDDDDAYVVRIQGLLDAQDEAMNDKYNRIASYTKWNNPMKHPYDLYSAGFYYTGEGDKVKCFSCGVCVEGWAGEDIPWIEHVKGNSDCTYLVENGQFFIDQINHPERIQEKKEKLKKYAKRRRPDITEEAINKMLHNNGVPFENEDAMILAMMVIGAKSETRTQEAQDDS